MHSPRNVNVSYTTLWLSFLAPDSVVKYYDLATTKVRQKPIRHLVDVFIYSMAGDEAAYTQGMCCEFESRLVKTEQVLQTTDISQN